MNYIMVLNDGETYTNLEGCAVVAVPDGADTESIERQLDADDGTDFVLAFGADSDGPYMIHEPDGTKVKLFCRT